MIDLRLDDAVVDSLKICEGDREDAGDGWGDRTCGRVCVAIESESTNDW